MRERLHLWRLLTKHKTRTKLIGKNKTRTQLTFLTNLDFLETDDNFSKFPPFYRNNRLPRHRNRNSLAKDPRTQRSLWSNLPVLQTNVLRKKEFIIQRHSLNPGPTCISHQIKLTSVNMKIFRCIITLITVIKANYTKSYPTRKVRTLLADSQNRQKLSGCTICSQHSWVITILSTSIPWPPDLNIHYIVIKSHAIKWSLTYTMFSIKIWSKRCTRGYKVGVGRNSI